MKKFLVVFASLGLALSAMAQDFNEAVETFNQAAQAESKAEALNLFKQAYTQFVACGEEAEAQDKVEELKGIIPAYSVAVAKESIAAKDYDAAIVALEAAAADCAEFGAEDKAAEVNDLFGFTYKASAKKALAAKDAQTAFSLLKKSVEYDSNDGEAQFLLGRLYLSSGKIDEAKAAFEIASANGREADVKKQLFTIPRTADDHVSQPADVFLFIVAAELSVFDHVFNGSVHFIRSVADDRTAVDRDNFVRTVLKKSDRPVCPPRTNGKRRFVPITPFVL